MSFSLVFRGNGILIIEDCKFSVNKIQRVQGILFFLKAPAEGLFKGFVDVCCLEHKTFLCFRTELRGNPSGTKRGGYRKSNKNAATGLPFNARRPCRACWQTRKHRVCALFFSPTGCPLRLPFPSPLFFSPACFFSRINQPLNLEVYLRISEISTNFYTCIPLEQRFLCVSSMQCRFSRH